MLGLFKRRGFFVSVLLLLVVLSGACARQWGKFWEITPVETTFNAGFASVSQSAATGVNNALAGVPISNYPVAGPFVIDFSASINASSATINQTIGSTACSGSIQVSLNNFSSCISLKSVIFSNSGKTFTVTPLPFLLPNTAYKLRLTTGLTNTAGQTLSAAVTSATITTKDVGKWGFAVQFSTGQLFYFSLNQSTGSIGTVANVTNPSISLPLAIDPTGKFLASSNNSGGNWNYCTINQGTGIPNTVVTHADQYNRSFAYHPTLSTLYGAGNTQFNQYSINPATGVPSNGSVLVAGNTLNGIGIHPNGKFIYVSSGGDNSLYTAQINETNGSLVGPAVQTVAGGGNPQLPVIEASGRFLYSPNITAQTMSYYSLNQSTGVPTLVGSIAVGSSPQAAAVDPTGRFVYIGNTGSNNISVFSINAANGAPTLVQTQSANVNTPTYIAIEATGRFLYLSNGLPGNTVASYQIDQQTGALSPINFQTATNAQGIAVY